MVTVTNGSDVNDSLASYGEWRFHNAAPIYTQIRDKLKWAILKGQLQPGETIPSIREMASILHINSNTVARAYRLVSGEGLIETINSKHHRIVSGNIVIQKIRAQEAQILSCSFVRGMMELGFAKGESLAFIKDYIQQQMREEAQ